MSSGLSLQLWRNPRRNQKPRHHIENRNGAGQLGGLGRIEVVTQRIEDRIAPFDIQRHRRSVANHQLFNFAQLGVCR